MPEPIKLPDSMTPKPVIRNLFTYSPSGFSNVPEKAIARRREYEERNGCGKKRS
ncbi:MAG: hypothetical protein OXC63_14260 [Aestuariivita sp.]|nr:hypothetical protein [Aestuariivita sp.]MCY4289740.1 hypothetical protein [Aestuariivita sp.]MCY4345183.1 hypothetical protein [Aestuariivita sp.]